MKKVIAVKWLDVNMHTYFSEICSADRVICNWATEIYTSYKVWLMQILIKNNNNVWDLPIFQQTQQVKS